MNFTFKRSLVGNVLILLLTTLPSFSSSYSGKDILKAKQDMIEISIRAYPGPCPCPYNSMRNGAACGRRSAYSKPGGYSPRCYKEDISSEQAAKFLESR